MSVFHIYPHHIHIDVKHFCDDVHKKVMEEIVDLNVLTGWSNIMNNNIIINFSFKRIGRGKLCY